jgi:hypothetical protein
VRVATGAGTDAALSRVLAVVNWSFKHLSPPILLIVGVFAGWLGIEQLHGFILSVAPLSKNSAGYNERLVCCGFQKPFQ